MPVFRLPEALIFPSPELADVSGLLAVGGDLSLPRLLLAYQNGIFPWYDADQPILWWSPDPRLVLEPEQLHISRSLKKRLRRGGFEIRLDTAFDAVIDACGAPRDEEGGTWLTDEMVEAYKGLFALGFAHSIEVWQEEALIGGLYGIRLGQAFFGESMFSRQSDASKIAMVALVDYLVPQGIEVIDCQVSTDHLKRMGAQDIPRAEFLRRLRGALEKPTTRDKWQWPGFQNPHWQN